MAAFDQGILVKYNSLTDRHLVNYFSNDRMRHHLIRNGLITKTGEVVPDAVYRVKMARREHRRRVRDLIAQAIIHKALEMERSRQIDIRKKIEEIAKIELVRRVREDRSRMGDEDCISYFTPGNMDIPTRGLKEQKRSQSDLEEYRLPATPDEKSRMRLRKILPNEEIESKHLSQLDSLTLGEYSRILQKQDKERINKLPYLGIGKVTLRKPLMKKAKKINKRKPESAGNIKTGETIQSGRSTQSKHQSMTNISILFHAPTQNRSYDVMVEQQPSGGNTHILYRDTLTSNCVFNVESHRRLGYPFSLTFYINNVKDSRISTCCESKHKVGKRIGGPNGHFSIFSVDGANPCFRCLAEKDMENESKGDRKKNARSSEADVNQPASISVDNSSHHSDKQYESDYTHDSSSDSEHEDDMEEENFSENESRNNDENERASSVEIPVNDSENEFGSQDRSKLEINNNNSAEIKQDSERESTFPETNGITKVTIKPKKKVENESNISINNQNFEKNQKNDTSKESEKNLDLKNKNSFSSNEVNKIPSNATNDYDEELENIGSENESLKISNENVKSSGEETDNLKENQIKVDSNNSNLVFISPTISPDIQPTNKNVLNPNESNDADEINRNDESENSGKSSPIDKESKKITEDESNVHNQMKKPSLQSDDESNTSASSSTISKPESKSKENEISSKMNSENKEDLKLDLSSVDHDSNNKTLSSDRLNKASSNTSSESKTESKNQPGPSKQQPENNDEKEEEEEHETSFSDSNSDISSYASEEIKTPTTEAPVAEPSDPSKEVLGIDVCVVDDDINFKRAKEICLPFLNGKINSITIRNCELPNYVFNFISDKLENHPELKSIELSGCEVEISLLNLLGNSLHQWPNLENLILSDNQFVDYSLQTLIDRIKIFYNNDGHKNQKQVLKTFDLSNCSIQQNDLSQLIELINENTRIEKYFFDGNEISEDMFMEMCKSLKTNTNVKLLSLKNCKISPSMVDQCIREFGDKFKGKLAI